MAGEKSAPEDRGTDGNSLREPNLFHRHETDWAASLSRLNLSEEHVAKGKRLIARQKELIAGLANRGAATTRNVPQIAFRPDWAKHSKAAPFKRNDAMLETLPIGVMVFPGNGIQDNLADKARKFGIPVWRIARK